MRKNDPIKHIMSDHIHTLQQGQAISAVFKIVHDHGVHHVPILNGEKLVGIVSSTDLMKLSMGSQAIDSENSWSYLDSQYQLIDVMTASPKTLSDRSVVRDAADALSNGDYHSLPVVNAERELIGIVTSTDLIRYLCQQY
ncbi:MAG: CBS domain-containing protein [Arenicella sp.]|jgi:CBS domain-containing protein